MMRVLLWMAGAGIIPGGHRVQLEKTAAALRALGVEVAVSFEDRSSLDGVDLVHGFGISFKQIRQCREHRIPVVLSTIYWSRSYTAGLSHGLWQPRSVMRRAKTGLSLAWSAVQAKHHDKCDSIVRRWADERVRYEMADLLLPNSQMEADAIRTDLGVTTPMHVVPNAVDPDRFDLPRGAQGNRKGVIYVGRVEPHKNQLGLVRALRGSGLRLTLVGQAHPHHTDYVRQVEKELGADQTWVPGVPHDELADLYQRHRVHVLPSWFETTGLVSLEAALCGCNIVTTDRGFAREYFQNLAWYCDPAKPQTIRSAVEAAHDEPFRPALRERVLDNYTWAHTASASLKAYQQVLRQNTSNKLMEKVH